MLENNIKNSNIILVSPSYFSTTEDLWMEKAWDSFDFLVKYNGEEINFDKLNKLWNKVVVFLSDNDPYIKMDSAKKYYSKINWVNFIEFKWKWHFNQWAWVLELEEILNYID